MLFNTFNIRRGPASRDPTTLQQTETSPLYRPSPTAKRNESNTICYVLELERRTRQYARLPRAIFIILRGKYRRPLFYGVYVASLSAGVLSDCIEGTIK